MANLQVSVVSPYGAVFEGEATRVQAPGADGGLEILARHAPMIAFMQTGAVTLTLSNGERLTYATSGGFIEVLGGVVTILGETVEAASEIDIERAKAAEERARARLEQAGTQEDRKRAEKALERARNRTRIGMGRVGQRVST